MARAKTREPAISAPWPALSLCALILAAYFLQSRAPDTARFTVEHALRPVLVEQGDWAGLFTSMFLHGGWSHAMANAAFALPFGAAVSRLLGRSAGGALSFFAFYLLCGLIGGLTHVAFNLGDPTPVVGASGAVSGLMGAGSRLLGRDGRLGPLFGPFVLALTGTYVALNLAIGAIGLPFGETGAAVAWQAHLGGYFAGLLLIGPWARIFGARRTDAPPFGTDPSPDREGGPWGARGSENEGS